jgi:hypothetical protein
MGTEYLTPPGFHPRTFQPVAGHYTKVTMPVNNQADSNEKNNKMCFSFVINYENSNYTSENKFFQEMHSSV